jgi:type II secretory pathway component HofQ
MPPVVRISVAVDGSLNDAAAGLARLGVLVTFDPRGAGAVVRGVFVDRGSDEVLESLAAQLGPDSIVAPRAGGVVYLGSPGENDLMDDVFSVPFGLAAEWVGVYKLAGSSHSSIVSIGDRIVAHDTREGIAHMRVLHERMTSVRHQYSVDVTVVELSETSAKDLGVEWGIDAGMDVGVSAPVAKLQTYAVGLKAALAASVDRGGAEVLTSGRLLVVEGEESSLQVGDSVPVPKRTVSPQGTVSDVDFAVIPTGTVFTVKARSVAGGLVRLDLSPEISAVTSFVRDFPVVSKRKLTSQCVLGSGGLCVLGGMTVQSDIRNLHSLPGIDLFNRRRQSKDLRRMFIFVRLVEVF